MYSDTYISKHISGRPHGWNYNNYKVTEDYFNFEIFDSIAVSQYIQGHWQYAFYAGGIYLAVIFSIQKYMKDKKPFELKWPFFLWNLTLGIFSIFGFLRSAPGLIYVLSKPSGLYTSLCLKEYMNLPFTFWTVAFAVSKFVELGDTVFIVMKKKPLIFLQWYHHVATLIGVWIMTPVNEPVGRWFVVLNYGVHSLMYPYFAMKTVGVRIPTLVANVITTLQFSQMILGLGFNFFTMYLSKTGQVCWRDETSINISLVLYGSFIFLFGKLFYDSVIKAGHAQKDKLK